MLVRQARKSFLLPGFLGFAIGLLALSPCQSQGSPAQGSPAALSKTASLDCVEVNKQPRSSQVAVILCADEDGASADWDMNRALAATIGIKTDDENRRFNIVQDDWRTQLDRKCSTRRYVDGGEPTQVQRRCVENAFHDRARFLRSLLSGPALMEAELSPEQHAEIQKQLVAAGYFNGRISGEFDKDTRDAIRRLQLARHADQTGFLSEAQLNDLLGKNTGDGKIADIANNQPKEAEPLAEISEPKIKSDGRSRSLELCSEALTDPLKYMIIDSLISGGKHLGNRLQDVKEDLEDQYGPFVTVNDDAVIEGVDRLTEKVGCSASYSADLKGLASKVLDEGATGRAQVLIRQMSQQGANIDRRVNYTVQRNSAGRIMVSFGRVGDFQVNRRQATCVLSYGGMCVLFR
jgi:uncharacterized protein YecT (DUF1311 family)